MEDIVFVFFLFFHPVVKTTTRLVIMKSVLCLLGTNALSI